MRRLFRTLLLIPMVSVVLGIPLAVVFGLWVLCDKVLGRSMGLFEDILLVLAGILSLIPLLFVVRRIDESGWLGSASAAKVPPDDSTDIR
jgi:hypothetical protein